MFKITIEGETLQELQDGLITMLQAVGKESSYQADDAAREKMQAERKAKPKAKATPAPQPEPEAEETDAELQAELNEPVEPMPETANAVVDAGTGKPAGKKAEAPIQMTMDDVKTAAAKLVAKDQARLVEILQKYKAANLSAVPKDKLGDFAADIMEALG
jgi:hypothetical protein